MGKLIRANLEPLGLTVHVAIDCEQAMAHLRGCGTDLVLLERDSQELEILPFLASLNDQTACRHPPVIVMSAEPPDRALLTQGPVVGYLQKPFSASALIQQVEQALASSSALGEVARPGTQAG